MSTPSFDPMAFLDATQQIVEMVAGHRAQLEAAGFSPTAAEAMSATFHAALVAAAFRTPRRTA